MAKNSINTPRSGGPRMAAGWRSINSTKAACRIIFWRWTNRSGKVSLDVEPFTMPGAPNPKVDLQIYDLESKQTVTIDVRSGKEFNDDNVGHYVFTVMWSPDEKELLFHRMDRRQKILELCAADPATGKVRSILKRNRRDHG